MKAFKHAFYCACLFSLAGFVPDALAANTGTVVINGRVPAFCDITVTQEAGAVNIDNIAVGDTDRLVATIVESCNSPTGYTVEVLGLRSTDHTGLFVDSVSADSHPFTLSYDGVEVNDAVMFTTNAPSVGVAGKDVRISYPQDLTLTPSALYTYNETLTFTIAAK